MRPNRIAFAILCAVLFGCHKHIRPVAQPPALPPIARTTIQPALDTTPPPALPPTPAALLLAKANRAFAEGKYNDAARSYEEYVNTTSAGDGHEQALFKWGLSYALQAPPDWPHAIPPLSKFVKEFPSSPLRPEASLILSLQSIIQSLQTETQSLQSSLDQVTADKNQRDARIKQLNSELDKLKRIDAERRKRP
jgi:hypothetical protein